MLKLTLNFKKLLNLFYYIKKIITLKKNPLINGK